MENIWITLLNKLKEKVDEGLVALNLKDAPIDRETLMKSLDKIAGDLDYRNSIVDLLKMLGMPHSLSARKQLAEELGCPPDLIHEDYSEMNTWLIDEVMNRIAESGGDLNTLKEN